MKISIEDLVFKGFQELYLTTVKTDFVKFGIELKVNCNRYDDNFKKLYYTYIKYLKKKYKKDYVKIHSHIVYNFFKKNDVYCVKNDLREINEILFSNLEISFKNDKKIYIIVPISYKEEYNYNINRFLNEINYKKIKNKSIDKVYENAFDYYTNNNINNLVVFDSESTSLAEYYNGNNNNESLYLFCNVSDNVDIIKMILEDFLKKNQEYIDQVSYENNKIKIMFSNKKSLEITDHKIIQEMSNSFNNIQNILIDKKIKKLNLKNK